MSDFLDKEKNFINKIKKHNLNGHSINSAELNTLSLFVPDNFKDLKIIDTDLTHNGQAICSYCGKNINITFKNKDIIVEQKCDFDFKDFEVEVDFSSGKIVNAEYLVTIAEHISNKSSFGFQRSHKNLFLTLKHFSKYKIFFPSIPNGQPSLYGKDGNYILVEGTDNDDEDVVSWNGTSPEKERLGCFFMDHDKAKKFKEAFDLLEEDFDGFDDINELEIIEVPKGIYKCKIVKEAMYNRSHKDKEVFIVGSMHLIK